MTSEAALFAYLGHLYEKTIRCARCGTAFRDGEFRQVAPSVDGRWDLICETCGEGDEAND